MRAFKRLGPDDIIDSTIVASTPYRFVSSSNGWTGNVGTSASIDLNGGWRARSVAGISGKSYHTAQEHESSGSRDLVSLYPQVSRLKVYNAHDDATIVDTDADKGQLRYRAIMRLYESKHEPLLYSSGSHVGRSAFFYDSTGWTSYPEDDFQYLELPAIPSAVNNRRLYDVTVEAWINLTDSDISDENVSSIFACFDPASSAFLTGSFVFGITNNGGGGGIDVAVKSANSWFVAGSNLCAGDWTHICFTRQHGVTSSYSFFVNGVAVATGLKSGSTWCDPIGATAGWAAYVGGGPSGSILDTYRSNCLVSRLRVWSVARTAVEISSSMRVDVAQTSSLVYDLKLDDGPLSTAHGFAAGSGAFDGSQYALHGRFYNLNVTTRANVPLWVLNDNGDMVWTKGTEEVPTSVRVIEAPSLMYGRQIATGSLRLTSRQYSSASLATVLVDDGFGGVFLTGSIVSGSVVGSGISTANRWNRVGNVFYDEGLIVLKEPTLMDFGKRNENVPAGSASLEIEFGSTNVVPTKTISCRVGPGESNASNNPTFSTVDERGMRRAATTLNPYVTGVALYDSEYRLVGFARLAGPLRKRPEDDLEVRLKIDF